MKKALFKIIPVFIVLALLFSLSACGKKGGEDKGGDDIKNEEPKFYDISELNYSPDYYNPASPEEKGFVLGDAIDFNRIKYNISYNKDPLFHIYYNEDPISIAVVKKNSGATLYSDFRFEMTGKYTILIVVPQETNSASAKVTFNVRACGIPERVLFMVKDSDGKAVTEFYENDKGEKCPVLKKGKTYTVAADIYSDGVMADTSSPKYSLVWEDGPASAAMTVTPSAEEGFVTRIFNFSFERTAEKVFRGKRKFIYYCEP